MKTSCVYHLPEESCQNCAPTSTQYPMEKFVPMPGFEELTRHVEARQGNSPTLPYEIATTYVVGRLTDRSTKFIAIARQEGRCSHKVRRDEIVLVLAEETYIVLFGTIDAVDKFR